MADQYDNAPELGALSLEEHTSVEAARGAVIALKKTFDHWITILEGLQTLANKAERMGNRKAFRRLREQAGLGEKAIPKSTVTRGFQIMEQLADVRAWRQSLSERQQLNWASPSAVFKHCPLFSKQDGARRPGPSPMEKLRQTNIQLQQELHQRGDGDRWKPTDSARDIATVMVGTFTANKADQIAQMMLQMLKEKKR